MPSNLPSVCEEESLEHIDYPSGLGRADNTLAVMIKQVPFLSQTNYLLYLFQIARAQEGTYVCSILRTCNPPFNDTLPEQQIISVSKQLYLKVYEEQDYSKDYLVVSSVLGCTLILLIFSIAISHQKTERIDHL